MYIVYLTIFAWQQGCWGINTLLRYKAILDQSFGTLGQQFDEESDLHVKNQHFLEPRLKTQGKTYLKMLMSIFVFFYAHMQVVVNFVVVNFFVFSVITRHHAVGF